MDIEIGVEMKAYNPSGELLTFKLRESDSKYIGNTYTTNKGEKFKVLGCSNIKNKYGSYSYFLIEFEDKVKIIVPISSVFNKYIKNPNTPSVWGIGFIGQGKYKTTINKKYTKEYTTWCGILQRCYSVEYQKKRPTYIGCTVDKRWHNFQNFCEDIQYLEGYENWKSNTIPLKYAIDKDIKIEGNKIYSKDTCMFVTTSENSIKRNLTGKTYEATNVETGETAIFTNQKEFAKKYNLNQRHISNCILGKRKTHKGWTFRIIESENDKNK